MKTPPKQNRYDTVKMPVPFWDRLSEWWFVLRIAFTSFPPAHYIEWHCFHPEDEGYEEAKYEGITDIQSFAAPKKVKRKPTKKNAAAAKKA